MLTKVSLYTVYLEIVEQKITLFFHSAISYARYDPTKGYHWEFPNNKSPEIGEKKQQSQREEPSDPQRRRVDSLLTDLVRKFPPKAFSRKVE